MPFVNVERLADPPDIQLPNPCCKLNVLRAAKIRSPCSKVLGN